MKVEDGESQILPGKYSLEVLFWQFKKNPANIIIRSQIKHEPQIFFGFLMEAEEACGLQRQEVEEDETAGGRKGTGRVRKKRMEKEKRKGEKE